MSTSQRSDLRVVTSREQLWAALAERTPGPVGLVPTMGALHSGHAANFDAARAECHTVVASIFVNPLQFDQQADLQRYPRPVEADLEVCQQHGVDLVWMPGVEDMYQGGAPQVRISAGPLADQLEGPVRPGHFDGMLTVVAKLFGVVRPDLAFFGEKDYQQLILIRRMVADLDLRVQVSGVATVRDPDGLALSSRNVFLSATERRSALALNRALRAAAREPISATGALAAAEAVLREAAGVQVQYLELRAPDLGPVPQTGTARLLIAAQVGSVRLIDNMSVELVQ